MCVLLIAADYVYGLDRFSIRFQGRTGVAPADLRVAWLGGGGVSSLRQSVRMASLTATVT